MSRVETRKVWQRPRATTDSNGVHRSRLVVIELVMVQTGSIDRVA